MSRGAHVAFIQIGFENLTDAQKAAQKDNYERRFKAALTAQPGLLMVCQLAWPDGTRVAISIWDSGEAAEEGGRKANAVPLLPGQVGEEMPGPSRVEALEVADLFMAASSASVQ